MGAQQSSHQEGSGTTTAKTCYYELLGVERQATDNEIKKAYRRRALELHPDRNINDVQTATEKFAEVQSAYEVLSDPQERAWYDSHRDAILSGKDQPGDGTEPTSFRNVRLTSTEELVSLMRKFNATVPFDDEPTGFYGIARETFEHLALEEEAAADFDGFDCPDYPTFGSSEDDYESVVKPFYATWAGFSTKKSFSWKDKYRLSDAPDRRVRRLMEKDNKKNRDDAIRDFNDAVRFLVTFVRKRDPRYLPNSQTDAERQTSLRVAAAAQAARSRAANQEKMAAYDLPEWSRPTNEAVEDMFSESEESEVEVLECVVCNKTFKSEKQFQAHERSKKHTKAVQLLRYQMRKEGTDLDLNGQATVTVPEQTSGSGVDASEGEAESGGPEEEPAVEARENMTSPEDSEHSIESDDYAPRNTVEDRLSSSVAATPLTPLATDILDDSLSASTQSISLEDVGPNGKIGKAKAKRERKAAQRARTLDENDHRCTVCEERFTSRTKLFNHIRDTGHAAPIGVASTAGGNKSKMKR